MIVDESDEQVGIWGNGNTMGTIKSSKVRF